MRFTFLYHVLEKQQAFVRADGGMRAATRGLGSGLGYKNVRAEVGWFALTDRPPGHMFHCCAS